MDLTLPDALQLQAQIVDNASVHDKRQNFLILLSQLRHIVSQLNMDIVGRGAR